MVEAKCVDHFDEKADGTCRRCGGFLCTRCMATALCRPCTERPESRPEPRRIGGWLILSVLTLCALPISAFSQLVIFVLDVVKYGGLAPILEGDPGWFAEALLRTLYSAALGAYAMFTLPGFFRKLSVTPTRMQRLYAASLTGNVLFTIVEAVNADNTTPVKPNYLAFIVPILWMNYFRTSKRVKQTFVR